MYDVKKETLQKAHKPFDIVTDKDGNVGYIQEVSVNTSQPAAENQIDYAVNWLIGVSCPIGELIHAWFDHDDLISHANLLIEIAKCACHEMDSNDEFVQKLFSAM